MEYKIIGGDGNEYGPNSLEVMKQWVGEGRIAPESKVMRTDIGAWSNAASFPELGVPAGGAVALPPRLTPITPAAVSSRSIEQDPDWAEHMKKLKNGSSWFYWIAGLTLINSIAAFFKSDRGFALGLSITQIIDAIAHSEELKVGPTGHVIAFMIDLVCIAVVVAFGIFAGKRHTWAFAVGGALYALDGLVYLLEFSVIGIAIHAFALFSIFLGFQSCREMNAADRDRV